VRFNRLPGLNALQTFEAAGRLCSFTKAAEVLHVTPGAVSRQIRALEEELGLDLFSRGHREVRLTEHGQVYLASVTQAFERLLHATEELLSSRLGEPLNIYSSMTLTVRWLIPRLNRFHTAHPKRKVSLHTTIPVPNDLREHRASVAVRMGTEDWIDAENRKLFEIKLVPVCRPELITSEPAKEGAVLNKYPLLLSKVRPDDWSSWAASAGLTLKPPSFIPFESSIIAFEAALSGVGIAIGQLPLVLDDLKSGKLIIPVNRIHKDGSYVSLAARPEFIESELFKEFRNWVRSEARLYVKEEETFCQEQQLRIR